MALLNNREVQVVTDRPHRYTDRNQVLVQHVEDPSLGTEVVDRARLVFSEDELNKMIEEEEKDMKARRESFQRDLKTREEEEKKSKAHQEEVQKARENEKPRNIWLKTGVYQKGDQVVDEKGVLYRSRANDNEGNQPSDKSDFWSVVITDRSGTAPVAAPANVLQTPTPQTIAAQQAVTQANSQPQANRASQSQSTQAPRSVTNSRTQQSQIVPQRGSR